MVDLSDAIASNTKIQELEKELKGLKDYVSGPKYLVDQTSKVYQLDAGAYYDPTLEDKNNRIKYLEGNIAYLNEQMKSNLKPIHLGTGKMHFEVQNFRNKNKEETNTFIGNSYYYQVGKSAAVKQEKETAFQPKQRVNTKSN